MFMLIWIIGFSIGTLMMDYQLLMDSYANVRAQVQCCSTTSFAPSSPSMITAMEQTKTLSSSSSSSWSSYFLSYRQTVGTITYSSSHPRYNKQKWQAEIWYTFSVDDNDTNANTNTNGGNPNNDKTSAGTTTTDATDAENTTTTTTTTTTTYKSNRIFHGDGYSNKAYVLELVEESFPVGAKVIVTYDPSDPEGTSVLRPGIQGVYLWTLLFMTPFHIITYSIWGVFIWDCFLSERHRRQQQQQHQQQQGEEKKYEKKQQLVSERGIVFLVALFFVSFLVSFIIIRLPIIPTVSTMIHVWLFVLGSSYVISIVYDNHHHYKKKKEEKEEEEQQQKE